MPGLDRVEFKNATIITFGFRLTGNYCNQFTGKITFLSTTKPTASKHQKKPI